MPHPKEIFEALVQTAIGETKWQCRGEAQQAVELLELSTPQVEHQVVTEQKQELHSS